GPGTQELKICFQHIFYSEKDVAKARLAHQGREGFARVRDRRGHRLHHIIQMVQPRIYDCLAERFESSHIEGDIVIDQKNRPGAVFRGITYVRQDPIERIDVKLSTPHLNDRAEAAIKGATAGSLDHIDLTTEHRIIVENPCAAVG